MAASALGLPQLSKSRRSTLAAGLASALAAASTPMSGVASARETMARLRREKDEEVSAVNAELHRVEAQVEALAAVVGLDIQNIVAPPIRAPSAPPAPPA